MIVETIYEDQHQKQELNLLAYKFIVFFPSFFLVVQLFYKLILSTVEIMWNTQPTNHTTVEII